MRRADLTASANTSVAPMPPGARTGKAVAIVAAALLLGACSSIKPWVKPYERDRLADPIMSWERDAISAEYLDHLYDSREGSRGATGTTGGGCGCN